MDKHNLKNEFPQFENKMIELKTSNLHFRKMYDEYHAVNNEIYTIEIGSKVSTDEKLNALRMQRLHLKDDLYKMLSE